MGILWYFHSPPQHPKLVNSPPHRHYPKIVAHHCVTTIVPLSSPSLSLIITNQESQPNHLKINLSFATTTTTTLTPKSPPPTLKPTFVLRSPWHRSSFLNPFDLFKCVEIYKYLGYFLLCFVFDEYWILSSIDGIFCRLNTWKCFLGCK